MTHVSRVRRNRRHRVRCDIVNRDKRTAIFETLRERMPAPTTELEYETPFELLIAVILSAQATDISVNKATVKIADLV